MKRGKESHDHVSGKEILALFWQHRGYVCFFEEGLADVLAVRVLQGRTRIVANEYERTTRNCVQNVRKDIERECDAVLIAVPNAKLQRAVRHKLRRQLPRARWTKAGVVPLDRIIALTPAR